jgi:hypothetical protein
MHIGIANRSEQLARPLIRWDLIVAPDQRFQTRNAQSAGATLSRLDDAVSVKI